MKREQQCALSLVTPEGSYTFNGDALDLLDSVVVSGQLRRLLLAAAKHAEYDLEEATMRAVAVFRGEYGPIGRLRHLRLNPAAAAGVEADIVRCYLRGLGIEETVGWLGLNKDFKTSRSAIGRYWSALQRLGFEPVPSMTAT